ncbi:hypothetical protein [Sphingomonas sp. BK481]|jgi:hypothetical protein|uniref:hypothetical protein n=1 Tax=Sphingomonas sp. BK481 TaxID=2586981 RepID=UPI00161530DA|nr:hypothetical protein [Sphingomonas sp. BK481]MBB3587126.1 hypothetical protein [Sphingomonas sp. BK481]
MRNTNATTSRDPKTEGRPERLIRRPFFELIAAGAGPLSGTSDGTTAVGRLETVVRRCSDVLAARYNGREVHGNVDGHACAQLVHAEVSCGGTTWLVSFVDADARRGVSTVPLETAAARLRYEWRLMTSTLLECASNRFRTLATVARYQHFKIRPDYLGSLLAILRDLRYPQVGDFVRLFGGGAAGFAHTVAAVARGYHRLGSHSVLFSSADVHRGRALPTSGSPMSSGCSCPTEAARGMTA